VKTDILLYTTQWVSLRRVIDEEHGASGYDYLHEDRCNGHIVSILPYRLESRGREVLLRREITPCWSMTIPMISSITGGVDDGEDPIAAAVRELEEEAGYAAGIREMLPLGTTFGPKSADTVYHLFAVDLTWKKRSIARGDGSVLESKAECFWTKSVSDAVDPLVAVSFLRLAHRYGYLGLNLGDFS
jgi:8-oxo-dGTP pyrophosphatase MutT (NUDIX family)